MPSQLHVQIDQPDNPPPPAGPPDFVQGGSIKPGQTGYAELWTMTEDGTTPQPHVPVVGWLQDASGHRVGPLVTSRTDLDGKIELPFVIPKLGTPDVSFATLDGKLSQFCFTAMRWAVPIQANAIAIPVLLV